MSDSLRTFDIAIVGAGIAGASVAWELSRRGAGPIVLIEKEALPGTHASGRNAALVLQNVSDEMNGRIAQYGARFYSEPPADLAPKPEFRRCGSLLLGSGPGAAVQIEEHLKAARARGLQVEAWSAAEAAARVPILDPSRFAGGVSCPGDGVIDIHALLHGFLKAAVSRGVKVVHNCSALGVHTESGAVSGIATSQGNLRCRVLVNAAGAWAGPLGVAAGVPITALRPTRRHLFVTEPTAMVDPGWPFVWDMGSPFYFRPESGGLLICPCDIVDAPDLAESVDGRALEMAAGLASALIPPAAGLGIAHAWSGIRTLTPDDHSIIGEDPRLKGFFWLAGLGGHGIVGAPASARMAADLIEGRATDLFDPRGLAPERFIAT